MIPRIITSLLSKARRLEKNLPHPIPNEESLIHKIPKPISHPANPEAIEFEAKVLKPDPLKIQKPLLSKTEQLLLSKEYLEKVALQLKKERVPLYERIASLRSKLSEFKSEVYRDNLMLRIRDLNKEIEEKTRKLREIEIKIELINLELRVK